MKVILAKYREEQTRLLALLIAYSYEERDVTLASGMKSHFYIDCKQVSFRGEGHVLIGRLFHAMMIENEERKEQGKPNFAACGGMALGAVPLASALSMTTFLAGRELPTIAVRKEAKDHGTQAFLEGASWVKAPARVLVVEDVITSGGSTIKAVKQMRDHGYVVDTVFSLVDREAGGEQALKQEGLRAHSLFNLSDFPKG